jgi:hypothetical protein
MATFYVTKYALTAGILKVDAEVHRASSETHYASNPEKRLFLRIGKDAYVMEAEAQRKAQLMLTAKIASTRKLLAKLSSRAGVPFEVVEG